MSNHQTNCHCHLTVAIFGVLGNIGAKGTSSVISHARFFMNNHQQQINFLILERLSVVNAFRLCCISEACVIVINHHFNNLELFRDILLLIENSEIIRKVLVLVDPMIEKYLYEDEFRKSIKKVLNYKVVSFSADSNNEFLSNYLNLVERSRESNELLEWLRELGPNGMNYEDLIYEPLICSIIRSNDSRYIGSDLLVKIESGCLTNFGELDLISEKPSKIKLYWTHDRFEWKTAHAGQIVPINDAKHSRKESHLLRGALYGQYFNASKGNLVMVDTFYAELTIHSNSFKFFKNFELKIYCGQRELISRVIEEIPLVKKDSFLVKFKVFNDLIYNRTDYRTKRNDLCQYRQPTFITTFENRPSMGLCMVKHRNQVVATGKIRKVTYLSDTGTIWFENSLPLISDNNIRKKRMFKCDISIATVI